MTVALQPDPVSALGYAMSAVAGAAFALRRRFPVLCLVVTAAAITAYTAADEPGGPIYVAVFLGTMNLAARTTTTREWLPWTAAAGGALLLAAAGAGQFQLHLLPVVALLLVLPKVVADSSRARVLRINALEARAKSAEDEAHRRIAEERLRIAREVHDVVGHGLAAISLRAGVADHVMEKDPRESQEALRAIRQISTDALDDLGALLGVLREGDGAERAPVPDLDAVPRLVDGMRRAGMDVDLEVAGAENGVSDVVGAAAYRIVQEALTNVARHAGDGARARVRLANRSREVDVEVVDDGRGAPPVMRDGRGLAGMRER